ncbi:MAG TPA: peptidoglycan-binding protein, partial [Xanthobacteraceae bacterium]|nr:peptidoglycan-binding protein [Xanthobacteraceae bacterium]
MSPAFTTDLLRDDSDRAGRLGGLFGRVLPRRRSDVMMLLLAAGASGVVLVNALAFQDGSRPVASLLDQLIGTPPVPLPPAAPAEARQAAAQPPAAPEKALPQAAHPPQAAA